jgi:hypothetical protein
VNVGLPRKTASVALTAIALALVGLHCGGDGRSPTSPPTPPPCAPPPRPSIVRIRTGIAYDSCCEPPGVLSLVGNRVEESTLPSYLEIMVHEARHVRGAPHTCGQSQDNTIADLGAFGVQYHLLMWLANHWPEANQLEREYALNRAAWLRATAFCGECQ